MAKKYLFILATFFLLSCENYDLSARETGALTGGTIGAGLGAIVGNQTGNPGAGVAIGAAVGALTGGVIGNEVDAISRSSEENEGKLVAQQREIEENRRLLDELRARGAEARITDRGVVVNIPDVLFEFNKSTLNQSAKSTIKEIGSVVKNSDSRYVSVEGHTDSIGSVSYNQHLSEERARSVGNALVREGMPRNRMRVGGYGESKPVASNGTESGRQRNRRVEIVIENRR